MSKRTVVVVAAFTLAAAAGIAQARKRIPHRPFPHGFGGPGVFHGSSFALLDPPVGAPEGSTPGTRPDALQGGTIAAIEDGALVIDGDSGKLVRVDEASEAVDSLHIASGATQLAVDRAASEAYVVDRANDRVVVVDFRGTLRVIDSLATDEEPFGIARSPKSGALLVTAVTGRTLTAMRTDGTKLWSVPLGPEPRGVAVAPDGDEALVTFLTTGAAARVDLAGPSDIPGVRFTSLNPPPSQGTSGGRFGVPQQAARTQPSSPDVGRSFARNAFAAIYVSDDLAVVPHQVSTPHLIGERVERRGTYGGGSGFQPPVAHRLAFVPQHEAGARLAMAVTNVHQPRAVAYDARSDVLYVAGFGSDDVLAVRDPSRPSVRSAWHVRELGGGKACGPTGIAVASDGGVLVHCALSRSVVRLEGSKAAPSTASVTLRGTALTPSQLNDAERRGQALFREGRNPKLSGAGALACTSCHAEGRADGLSWRIEGHNLQTPILAGRVVGTHPFKWDGQDRNLPTSLRHTVKRLGGSGLTRRQAQDLQAFLATLDRPRAPTPEQGSVARGRELFRSDATRCATCHSGPLLTDRKRHALAEDLPSVDTPSLVGLAVSAPYYHDGSARTLRAVLMGNGTIHGMGRTSKLTDHDVTDLVAYMRTL